MSMKIEKNVIMKQGYYENENYSGYYNETKEIDMSQYISIEWIKKWAKKNGLDCYDYDYPTEKNDWWYAIEKMLEDWEKENEIN